MKTVVILTGIALAIMYVGPTPAQQVKYCRDARDGTIIVVEAGMPCPYPTHEL